MTEPNSPARSLSGVAIAGCLFIVLMQCGTLLVGGASQFVQFVQDGGIFMLLVMALYVLGAVAIAALGVMRLRGREIPLATLVVPASLPLVAAVLGSRIAVARIADAVDMVEPASRAMLLARGTSEALLLGIMGTASAATLLACCAWVVSLEGPRARLAHRSPIGTIGMPLVWLGVGGAALVVGAVFHPDGHVGPRALSVAFLAAALASGVAGLGFGQAGFGQAGFGQAHGGDGPNERAVGAAFAVPALGVAIAYLTAYQLRLSSGMLMFNAVAGADAGSRLLMMDQGLYEAGEEFQAALWLMAGPLAAMAVAAFLGRASLMRIVSGHRVLIGAAAAMLVVTMGAAAVTQATFVVAVRSIAGGGTIELPATNATLPRVQTEDVVSSGPIVIIDDELRVEGNTLGPRAVLNQAAALRPSMEGYESLVVFADQSVSAGELVGLLSATVDDYPLEVQVAVDSGPASRQMVGPLRDLPRPPPAVVFSFLAIATEGPRLHVTVEGLTLHQSGRASSLNIADVGMVPAIVTAEANVPLGRVLEVLARFGYQARLAPMPLEQMVMPEPIVPETVVPE